MCNIESVEYFEFIVWFHKNSNKRYAKLVKFCEVLLIKYIFSKVSTRLLSIKYSTFYDPILFVLILMLQYSTFYDPLLFVLVLMSQFESCELEGKV